MSAKLGPKVALSEAIRMSQPKAKLKPALAKGLKVKVTTDEPCTGTVVLQIPAAVAKKLKLGKKAQKLASKPLRTTQPGSASLVLKPGAALRKKLAKVKSLKLQIVVTCKDAAGNSATANRALTLKR